MTAVLVWALGALVVGFASPGLIVTMMRRRLDSHVTLVVLGAIVVGTLAGFVVPVILSLAPSHAGVSGIVQLAHRCWVALHDDAPAQLETAVGLVGAVVLLVAAVRLISHVSRAVPRHRALHRQHVGLVRILHGSATTRSTAWVPLAHPIAYSVAGRPALVVASSGLRDALEPTEVAAVLAHEAAHIRGRHHLMVAAADAVAHAFPWLPIMRRSPGLVRALVEIDADAVAARTHGREAVRRALVALNPHSVPEHALGMADADTVLRLERLASDPRCLSGPLRLARTLVATVTAVALPIVPVTVLLGGMALASCVGT
ncbi:M56 family metallopeptidase [Rhodococcus kroppenstedtii]|uniref:M56 family metallopeptidase n=1 Tax=Rhodococcoides kroppenstedtii TaxID=293050 RepID=UPI002953DFDF|nr:M56 family metallopeptidase [Rhodococcus kroppenstedtii]MDV7199623.1 M56 family metallopeptidase [Rhodococcus kroppenstedtii]